VAKKKIAIKKGFHIMKDKKRQQKSLLAAKSKKQCPSLMKSSRREFLKQTGYRCIGFAGLVFSAYLSRKAFGCPQPPPCPACNIGWCNEDDCTAPTPGFHCGPNENNTCPGNDICNNGDLCNGEIDNCTGTEDAPNWCNKLNICSHTFDCTTNVCAQENRCPNFRCTPINICGRKDTTEM